MTPNSKLIICMWKLRGRKAKAQQTYQLQLSFSKEKRPALDGIPTTLCSLGKRSVYQLNYLGNSAGRGSNLQHSTTLKQLQLCMHRSELIIEGLGYTIVVSLESER